MAVTHTLRKTDRSPDPRFTLTFDTCRTCGLLQIVEPISPDVLYVETDTYLTGFHKPRHLDDLITTAIAFEDPTPVVDVGCNDGSLMDALVRHGYPSVVGVEPNRPAAEVARQKGYEVHGELLSIAVANKLIEKHGAFGAAYVRHVIEHVGNLDEFFGALRCLVRDEGLLVVELPHVEPGFQQGNPAILWEEHVNYLTEPHAIALFASHGFELLDRRYYAFGGGAVAFITRKKALPARREINLAAQSTLRMVEHFVSQFGRYRAALNAIVTRAREAGYQVAMYGAAPRSCIVAAACEITDSIDIVIDDRSEIQGYLMPGTGRRIEALAPACARIEKKLLCLLGVGSENEFKVRSKLVEQLRFEPVCISLFHPRNTLDSISQAARCLS